MNKQKSKSNILFHEKKELKPSNFTLKSKDKNPDHPEDKVKPNLDPKKHKGPQKQSKSNKNTNLKSKNQLQKSSHPKILEKPDHQFVFSVQRRNSASIVSQRAPSRLSNKRSSVISSKSIKYMKNEDQKENDQNRNNIDEIQNQENECIAECLKKSVKNAKSKKKLSLNLNPKPQAQTLNQKDIHKKVEKGEKVHMFEKKLSKYLNQKNIFSQQFLKGTKREKSKSIKNLNAKSKQKPEDNLIKSNKITDKENLMEIYHKFYKKSFDINLTNCMKYNSHASKDDKSRQSTLKPSQSSTLIFKKQNNLKLADSRMDLCKRKNGSNCSNGSKSGSKSKQTLSKSRKNESKSIVDKENRLFSHIQMSSLLQSRSKSRNSMVNKSQTSTKDHVFSYQVERQCANNTIEETNLRRSKKSFKNLIVFNQNQAKSNQPELSIKYFDKRKSQVEDTKQLRKLFDFNGCQKLVSHQDKSEVIDMRKVEVGQSNIDVLKWWSNSKRQLSTSVIHEKQNQRKNQTTQPKSQFLKNQPQNQKDLKPNSYLYEVKSYEDTGNFLKSNDETNAQKMIPNQQLTEKLIKKKSEQISSLGDLSSISSIHEYEASNSKMVGLNSKLIQMQDIAFEF